MFTLKSQDKVFIIEVNNLADNAYFTKYVASVLSLFMINYMIGDLS